MQLTNCFMFRNARQFEKSLEADEGRASHATSCSASSSIFRPFVRQMTQKRSSTPSNALVDRSQKPQVSLQSAPDRLFLINFHSTKGTWPYYFWYKLKSVKFLNWPFLYSFFCCFVKDKFKLTEILKSNQFPKNTYVPVHVHEHELLHWHAHP